VNLPRSPYRFGKRLSDGLVGLSHVRYGEQLWSSCATRKARECNDCCKPLPSGAVAFRPLTNAGNRMDRLCVECVARKERPPCIAPPVTASREEIPANGACFHCRAACTDDNYCCGCKAFVCDGCEHEFVMGFGHEPEEHLAPEERTL
jgi:hypothetical protein